jgi:phospholipid/cholesterol/gamma-HCH transport system permease protein
MAEPAVVSETSPDGDWLVRIGGDLVLEMDMPSLRSALLGGPPSGRVILDMTQVSRINTFGVAALLDALCEIRNRGGTFEFLSLHPSVHEMLAMVPPDAAMEKTKDVRPPPGLFEQAGEKVYETLDGLASAVTMVSNSLYWSFVAPVLGRGLKTDHVFQQVSRHGVDAIPIVTLIMLVVGCILALQADYQLRRLAASIYVADLVGVSLTRELGPLMVAVILAGRSGASIAAEIGTMRVTEEIDALVTMGMNPLKHLVAPRVLGLTIALPALVIVGEAVGLLTAFLVAVVYLDIPAGSYVEQTRAAILLKDVLTGLVKSVAFALIISLVGCVKGYTVSGGPQEIGRATTAAVVTSLFLVIAADGFFTTLFYLFG